MNYQIKIDVTKINKADLFVGEKGTYLTVDVWDNGKIGQYGDSHTIKQVIGTERYKNMTEEERKATPIIGNMKPKEIKQSTPQTQQPPSGEMPF